MTNQYFNTNPFQQFFSAQMPEHSTMRESFSKNMQAISTANQIAMEWAQTTLRRNAETTQKAAHKSLECARETMHIHSFEDFKKIQSQYLSHLFNSSYEQVKEMLEVTNKAAVEILDMYSSCMPNTCNKEAAQPAKKASAA